MRQAKLENEQAFTPLALVPKGLLNTALLIIVLWGIAEGGTFLIPLCISGLLAFLLAPLVRVLRRGHVPEWLAIIMSSILLLLPFSAGGYLLISQGEALSRDFPRIVHALDDLMMRFAQSTLGKELNLGDGFSTSMLVNRLASRAVEGLQLLLTGVGALLNAGSQIALILLFTVLMLASRIHLRRSVENILARNKGIEAALMLDDITRLIERFLIARLLIVLLVGAIDAAILALFGLNYSILLAAFLGVMTLVPAIGFILAVIPPLIVSMAMGHSALSTVGVGGALFVMSIIEGNLLTPSMVGKSLNINALTTFVGLFAGGLLWGIWGMLLAIPILGILRIIFTTSSRLQPWGDLLADKPNGGAHAGHLRRPREHGAPRPSSAQL